MDFGSVNPIFSQNIDSSDAQSSSLTNRMKSGSQTFSEGRVMSEMQNQGLEVANGGDNGKTFSDIFKESVQEVNQAQHQADHAIRELLAGRTKNIHETLLTVEKADASLKLMMQVRNKILDAYKEIMRMQV